MIGQGLLDRVPPEEIYALHCGPLPVGAVGVMPGVGQPGLDVGHIDVSGPDALTHAGRLVDAINGLSTIRPPRSAGGLGQLLEDLQRPDGPLARFVVATARTESAGGGGRRVRLWLRAWPDERYAGLRHEVRRIAGSVGAQVSFPQPRFPAMVCSPELSRAAAAYLRDLPGTAVTVLRAAFPFQGDDFALFLRQVPGAMFILGVADPAGRACAVPHARDFVADERAIGFGVRAMAGLLWHRLTTLR
jgi:metal-dependent amidase/aminoacylase/carboxypeptidase family protein